MTVEVDTPFARLAGRATGTGLAFLGIPYAEPPVGALRFRPPVPRARMPDGVDATRARAAPLQSPRPQSPLFAMGTPPAVSEDCLTLNVWTPAADDARRPVLVHIFGGGFQSGSATDGFQDAARLSAQGDCVVVRVGFRVGILGFLHLGGVWGAPYEAGNCGLLDVVCALGWIAENIAALGGDPGNVTIFGLSSGAFMAAALPGVPKARPLFRRAFMQSGSASRVIAATVAAERASDFLAAVGVRAGDQSALESLSPEAILSAQGQILAADLGERNAPGGRALGIVLDGSTLTQHPLDALRQGNCRDMSLVFGTTRDESRHWFSLGVMAIPSTHEQLQAEIGRFFGRDRSAGLLRSYRERLPQADLAFLREAFLTDAVYRLPAVRSALAQAGAGGRAHLFRFDWTPAGDKESFGASHGFDEPFVWGVGDPGVLPLTEGSATSRAVAAAMSGALLSFSRTGDPGWLPASGPSPVSRVFGSDGPDVRPLDDALLHAYEGLDRR